MKLVVALIFGFIVGWFAATAYTQKQVKLSESITTIPQNIPPITQQSKKQLKEHPTTQLTSTLQHTATNADILSEEFAKLEKFSPQSLFTQVAAFVQQGNYQQALIPLTELIYQIQDVYSEKDLNATYIGISQKILQQLTTSSEKIEFLRQSIVTLPNNLELRYLLAQELMHTKAYTEAEYQLSFLAYQPSFADKFDTLTKKIQYNKIFTSGEIHIPLIKKENSWHINAIANGNNITLILDTGASKTTIADNFLTQNIKQTISLSTANGIIMGNIYSDNTLTVGSIIDTKLDIVGLPHAKLPATIDGLLGLDWLGRFNFIIDAENNMLRLISK